jgi:hypothetical protein
MKQRLSWEATRSSGSQEIPRILRNLKVHCRIHIHLSPSWARSIHSMSHPTSWRYVLILSSHLRVGLASGLLPSGVPTKTLYKSLLPLHTCYMPCSPHSSGFDRPNIWLGAKTIKRLTDNACKMIRKPGTAVLPASRHFSMRCILRENRRLNPVNCKYQDKKLNDTEMTTITWNLDMNERDNQRQTNGAKTDTCNI